MRRNALFIAASFVLIGALLPVPSLAQPADFSGTYFCEPQPLPCRLGETYTIAQTGTDLVVTIPDGDTANGEISGDAVLTVGAPLNMLGLVRNGAIEWSNGTKWTRQ